MSLALFRSELRSAVRAAQTETAGSGRPPAADESREPSAQADVLRRVARGEISVDAALRALGDRG